MSSAIACALFAGAVISKGDKPTAPNVATYSIVAFDPKTGDLGVAVQSKFFGVGSVVPYVKAGVGAIATQAYANPEYGPKGLELLKDFSAEGAVSELTRQDASRDHRQLAIVKFGGEAAAYTGSKCTGWAGDHIGFGYSVQGNILAGETVIRRMAARFETAREIPNTELADWMLEALKAAEEAGGDRRGRQSAAIMVARKNGGYANANDRYIDLRVEDHANPVHELGRLLDIHKQFYANREVPAFSPAETPNAAASQERWGWPVFLLLLAGLAVVFAVSTSAPPAPELGVTHGRLTDVSQRLNAVSSHASLSEHRVPPIKMDQSLKESRDALRDLVMGLPRVKLIKEDYDYIRFECRTVFFRFVDDLEFYFDEIDKAIHVRSAARCGFWDLGVNRRRVDRIRELHEESRGDARPGAEPNPALS